MGSEKISGPVSEGASGEVAPSFSLAASTSSDQASPPVLHTGEPGQVSGRFSSPLDFDRAVRTLPAALQRSFDPMQHKTLDDLRALAEHELDLYEEGEETDIRSKRQAAARRAVKRQGPQTKLGPWPRKTIIAWRWSLCM